jgi:hypothetical protein
MAHAAVKYVGSATAIYSRSPKLRIPLTGIPTDVASEDIDVVLSSSAGPLTPGNKFYAVTKNTTASGVVLKLLDGKQWGIFSDVVVPPVNLHLTQVYFTDSQGNKVPQLVDDDADVIVARLLRTPSVDAKTDLIYETGTKTIVLSGTGLKGAKTVKLFFDPPMFLGVDYQISGGQFDNGLKKDQGTHD